MARAWIVGAALLALSGCGFAPLYGEAGGTTRELERVRIDLIADRSGQILRNRLLDDLAPRGPASPSLYALSINLSEPRQEIGIRRDDTASRIGYAAIVQFRLSDAKGALLLVGRSSSSTTYEVTTSEFATVAARQNARDRAMQEISLDIRNQLAAYFLEAQLRAGR